MRISLLIKTLLPDQSNPKLVCPKEMVFQQKLLEKAYLIVKMIDQVMVWPASSYFWKQFILQLACVASVSSQVRRES